VSNGIDGWRWMVSPDGYQADLVYEAEVRLRCPDWTDCTEMSDAEVMKLMERRMLRAKNVQLPMAA